MAIDSYAGRAWELGSHVLAEVSRCTVPETQVRTDMIDLEPVIAQYDPGIILICPLHSLGDGSSLRYFEIVGYSSSIVQVAPP
jgi:hypothetical protein